MKYLVIALEDYGDNCDWEFDCLDQAVEFIQSKWADYHDFRLYSKIDFNVKVTVELA